MNTNRELREVPQPASAEYLSTLREAETNSRFIIGIIIINCNHRFDNRCSGSLESRGSRAESVYEMGDDYSDHDQVPEPEDLDADQHLT